MNGGSPCAVLDILSLRSGIRTLGSKLFGPLLYFIPDSLGLAWILATQKINGDEIIDAHSCAPARTVSSIGLSILPNTRP